MKRAVFIISDGTGITAENLGNSLITQFEDIEFEKQTIPYLDCLSKADAAVARINKSYEETGIKPLVFMTLIKPEIVKAINNSHAKVFDLFNTFIGPLEQELQIKSSYTVGRTHGVANPQIYSHRIEAVEYALSHDDGIKIRGYDKADLILVGVSRCGKTPSCLYMALQFGIWAANYPFAEDELSSLRLPAALKPYKKKLFGLSIEAERLQQIRTERCPNSLYASIEQCRLEVAEVETMYQREGIPYINSTYFSIEEIATKVLTLSGVKRRL